MSEWHVLPEHINHKWTPRLLHRMVVARNRYLERLDLAANPDREPETSQKVRVSAMELFHTMGIQEGRT